MKPTPFVILIVGIGVALLGAPDLIARTEHGDPLREQQRREQVPLLEGVPQVLIPCWTGARRDSSMEEERSRRFCLLHILHGVVNQHL